MSAPASTDVCMTDVKAVPTVDRQATVAAILDVFVKAAVGVSSVYEDLGWRLTVDGGAQCKKLPGYTHCVVCSSTSLRDFHVMWTPPHKELRSRADDLFRILAKREKEVANGRRVLATPKVCHNEHVYWPGGGVALSPDKVSELKALCMSGDCSCLSWENIINYFGPYYADAQLRDGLAWAKHHIKILEKAVARAENSLEMLDAAPARK